MKEEKAVARSHAVVAVIPAAGAGVRMGSHIPKQFMDLQGKPLLALTLLPFQHCRTVDAVILVVPASEIDFCRKEGIINADRLTIIYNRFFRLIDIHIIVSKVMT